MVNIMDIMQLCRLCLVKDQVNIPIFEEQGDVRQIFLKITACLPVKVSRDDNLPKKICDGCLYKLELLYQFWNTTANAEKQLLSWLSQAGIEPNTKTTDKAMEIVAQSHAHPHSDNVENQIILKQESIDPDLRNDNVNDSLTLETNYVMQQQQLPYESFTFEQSGYEAETSLTETSALIENEVEDEPAPKRRRRAVKAVPIATQESDDENVDDVETMQITKTEEESEEEVMDESIESTSFVGISNTDNEQPGPSGVGKTSTEAPYDDQLEENSSEEMIQTHYECEVCTQLFSSKKAFLEHHMNQFGQTFTCCKCETSFKNSTELYQHYEVHKNEANIIITEENEEEGVEIDYTENVEAVMNIPNEEVRINETSDLLYILDDSQCVNEVVIEEECPEIVEKTEYVATKPDNYTVVQLQMEHGYMIPSVFKGQLQAKRRYKRKDVGMTHMESDSDDEHGSLLMPVKTVATTSKRVYTPPKPRIPQPKRRHEVPDFSSTNYIVLNPNEEVNIPHYKCLRCEQLFINKFVFFRHIERGKCYVNSCDVCTETFTKNSEFYEHYINEHTDRAICNFCFRTFMYEKNVKEHMLRHLDQFRHRCEECNKGFYTVREYRNHYKNRHMGIRHKCEVCGRSFADEYYFKRHIATHNKAKQVTTYVQ